MSADQQADQLDNLSGTPPEPAPHQPQEFPSDVDSNVDAQAPAEFPVGAPAINPASVNTNVSPEPTPAANVVLDSVQFQAQPGRSSTSDAWPQADQRVEIEEGPKIRQVALLPAETPTHIFSGADGLTSGPPATGPLLVVTNQRLIAFCNAEGKQETYLVPMNEVKHVVVKAGSRSASMLLQGSLMVVAGIFIYLVLGYWLTDQIEGPTIPVLHMDVAPFIALIIVLTGLTMIAQVYFTKPEGTVTVQGDRLQFIFPFHGDDALRQIFEVVNTAFATRQTKLQDEPQLETRHSPPSEASADPRLETGNSPQLNDADDPPSPWASST